MKQSKVSVDFCALISASFRKHVLVASVGWRVQKGAFVIELPVVENRSNVMMNRKFSTKKLKRYQLAHPTVFHQ